MDLAARLSAPVLGRRKRLGLSVLAGVFAALGHAPFNLAPLSLVGLTLAAMLLGTAPSWRNAAWIGWAVGSGYFAFSLFWIVEPFLVDIARHGWMAPFALVFLSAGLALFWALGFGMSRWLSAGPGAALALALTLPTVELARAYMLTGFPWAMVSYIWVGWGPDQLAALVGSHGLSVLTLGATGGAAVTLLSLRWGALAATLAFSGAMIAAVPAPVAAPGGAEPVVRLIQPNAEQHLKWRRDMVYTFFERQLAFTAAPPGPLGPPDLVIWPETAVPFMLERAEGALAEIAAAAGGTPVALGIQRRDGADVYNSMAVLGLNGEVTAVYDKHHLVPFGEYMPAGWLMQRIGLAAIASVDAKGYSAGPGPRLLDLGPLGRALPLICYEAIFPQDILGAPERPDWLLQITNDAWFGTFSGPYQHLAQAQMRAIEQRLPMVRVANTGVSAVIDPSGAIVGEIPLGEAGYLDVRLPAAGAPTLYSRTGDAPLALLLVAAVALLSWRARRNAD